MLDFKHFFSSLNFKLVDVSRRCWFSWLFSSGEGVSPGGNGRVSGENL